MVINEIDYKIGNVVVLERTLFHIEKFNKEEKTVSLRNTILGKTIIINFSEMKLLKFHRRNKSEMGLH